ncbi:pentapeptide repeat-containing protein [Streptomyces sp. NPDC048425]|uniref:pentapeptide repeat-containing protein n=1 Tax=Streptomyces sp. NPDC048425 TaxID=3365548 RepID=UPI003714C89B
MLHLEQAERDTFLGGLQAGDDLDFRGTVFGSEILTSLLDSLISPADGAAYLGKVNFEDAYFLEEVDFSNVTFNGEAIFKRAWFDTVNFGDSLFRSKSSFEDATFSEYSYFDSVEFEEVVDFVSVKFAQAASFDNATFSGYPSFLNAKFESHAFFQNVLFLKGVDFDGARFAAISRLGPIVCVDLLDLSRATFVSTVSIQAVAARVRCENTHWESTATLRLRRASVDLADAVLTQPLAVTAHPVPFITATSLDESGFPWSQQGESVESLRGIDCAMLSLSDVDLTSCLFAGAFHLDQLRLEGRWTFGVPPAARLASTGPHFRWTQRQVVEEERQWRALPGRPAMLRAGWGQAPNRVGAVPGLATITTIYRQLRKAREDAKDEPGAADFYYGEMEMRRHSHNWRKAERWLLQAYWLLSGYGLRASRALGWLSVAMTLTIFLLMGWGLPDESPRQEIKRESIDGKGVTVLDTPDPVLATPLRSRFTGKRFDKGLSVTLNSVVFRSSGQNLTTAGGYIEMASRFSEPVLLGLGALAIRGRVKRGS